MFRSDRDALAAQVDDLREERERLRAENEAMRADLLHRRLVVPTPPGTASVYKSVSFTPGEHAALAGHSLKRRSTGAALVLHFLTFGIYSWIHFSLMHDRLPQAEHDDPGAAKAIGFSFIPYFNFYWVPFNILRLVDRLNLQLRLQGETKLISRNLAMATAVFTVVPYVNLFIGLFILWPILVVRMQRAVNRLVDLSHREEPAPAPQVRMRVPRVEDLPLPEDVAAQQEADAALEDEAREQRRMG